MMILLQSGGGQLPLPKPHTWQRHGTPHYRSQCVPTTIPVVVHPPSHADSEKVSSPGITLIRTYGPVRTVMAATNSTPFQLENTHFQVDVVYVCTPFLERRVGRLGHGLTPLQCYLLFRVAMFLLHVGRVPSLRIATFYYLIYRSTASWNYLFNISTTNGRNGWHKTPRTHTRSRRNSHKTAKGSWLEVGGWENITFKWSIGENVSMRTGGTVGQEDTVPPSLP